MTFQINQKVTTPIGSGHIQGRYENGGWLVRMKISEITRTLISTITPYAKYSGLWAFSEKEIK